MPNRIEPGDRYTNDRGWTSTLELVSRADVNERVVSVYLERNDDELTDVPDHFTVEVYDVDEVTEVYHDLWARDMATTLLKIMNETFNG
jgi:hypothetical protein